VDAGSRFCGSWPRPDARHLFPDAAYRVVYKVDKDGRRGSIPYHTQQDAFKAARDLYAYKVELNVRDQETQEPKQQEVRV